MAVLTYNGIQLGPLLETKDFRQEAVYDDSGVNVLYWKYTIAVTAYLSGPLASQYGGTNGETPMAGMKRIRSLLLQPRAGSVKSDVTKGLSFKIAGVELIPAIFSQGTPIDCRGGPYPQACNITRLTEATFMIDYRIETYRIEPIPPGLQSSFTGILSIRYRDEVNLDENGYTLKKRTGKIVISQGNNVNLDRVRETLVTTSLDPGFKRISSDYSIAEDGCSMVYVISDKEQFLMPPGPASKASGWYAESGTLQGGAYRQAAISIHLEGPKRADKASLIGAAVLIANRKFVAAGGLGSAYPIMSFAIRESLWENIIDVNASCRLPAKTLRTGGFAVVLSAFSEAPAGCDPGTLPPDLGTRGSANVLLNAAAYWDPFVQATLDKATNNYNNNQVVPGKS